MQTWKNIGSFIGNHMVLFVPLCLVAALFFTGPVSTLIPFISPMFAFVTFQSSLNNTFANLARVFRHPKNLLVTILVAQGCMPVLIWLLGSLLFTDADIVTGLVLEYSVPVAVMATLWVSLAGGDMSLTLSTILVSTLISPFTIPATLQLLMGATVHIDATGMIVEMIFTIAIPALVGTAANDLSSGSAGSKVAPALAPASRIMMLLIIAGNATNLHDFIFNLTPGLVGVIVFVAVMICVNYLVGYLLAKALHDSCKTSIAVTYCASLKNIAAGSVIAQSFFPAATMFPVITTTLFNEFLAALFGKLITRAFSKQ